MKPLQILGGLLICHSCFADIIGTYHCESGRLFNNQLLSAKAEISKIQQQYHAHITWNNGQSGDGILHPTAKPDVYIEQWSAQEPQNHYYGLSKWQLQKQQFNVIYYYIGTRQGHLFQGEINCQKIN